MSPSGPIPTGDEKPHSDSPGPRCRRVDRGRDTRACADLHMAGRQWEPGPVRPPAGRRGGQDLCRAQGRQPARHTVRGLESRRRSMKI